MPSKINSRVMKKSIGKGATALADFSATSNLFHQGFHHETFREQMDTVVQASQAATKATEAAYVQVVEDLYQHFLNLVKNVDIIFNGTWKTCGHNSNIAVRCVLELYSGPALDHTALSR